MTATTAQPVSRFHLVIDIVLRFVLVLAAVTVVGFGVVERWRLASALPWQTDELPLLTRFTGVTGQVTNEEAAESFQPTRYLLRTGAMRALQPPKDAAALHTTTNFWTNLAIFVGGVKPWVARFVPFVFAIGAIAVIVVATRAIGGGLTATVIAVGLAALSPMGILYAAQARGYSEAIFLTPLLLLCIDALRRHPRNLLRAVLVLVCALQLSLTVYTMWVYWVLPNMLAALIWMPAQVAERESSRQLRFTLGFMVIALTCIMAIYTLDRWSALTFTAEHMGERIFGIAATLDFAGAVARVLTPMEELVAVPAFLGLVILLRSECRWWGLAICCSALVPLAFNLTMGSAGYARNFAYLLGPLAMLAGLGIERFLIALLERRHRVLVHATTAVLVLAGMVAAWEGTTRDARSLILPNWGGVVEAMSHRPLTAGPRWISPCLTHHWPINWYQGPDAARRVVAAPDNQPIELLIGTTCRSDGLEVIYREDARQQAIVEAPAPTFLTKNARSERMHGVNLRSWLAYPLIGEGPPEIPTGDPYWMHWLDDGADTTAWDTFVEESAESYRFVAFKPSSLDGRLLRTMVVDGSQCIEVTKSLQSTYEGRSFQPRVYKLTPMQSFPEKWDERVDGPKTDVLPSP